MEQITSWTQLHDDKVMLRGFQSFVQFHYILVSESAEDCDFIAHLFLRLFIFHKFHVDTFDCDQFPCESLHAQVDLAECAFAQYFSDFVKFDLGFRRFIMLLKTFLD